MRSIPNVITSVKDSEALGREEVLKRIAAGEITCVIVGGADTNGVFRAKRVPASRLDGDGGVTIEFSSYMWVMDLDDYPQPRPAGYPHWWPSWEDGFGDVEAQGDATSLRVVPWLDRTALLLTDYYHPDGREVVMAPRGILRRVVARAAAAGLHVRMAPEYEFFILRENEASAAQKHFQNLNPLADRPQPYGAMQSTLDTHIVGPLVEHMRELRITVPAWGPEGGPGQYELNIDHQEALEAADQGFLFKHSVKEICQLNGLLASFMSKINEQWLGSSMHVHQSLVDADGRPSGYAPDEPGGMSAQMRRYLAGLHATMRDFAVLFHPTPNSYKRLAPGTAAGTTCSWGYDNKSMGLRVLAHSPDVTRIEHRLPGADANIYLAFAAMIAGGLYGIENELPLAEASTGNAYANPDLELVPHTLDEAVRLFEESPVARTYLGDEFVDYYAATRRWELEQMRSRVTDWELRRYLARV